MITVFATTLMNMSVTTSQFSITRARSMKKRRGKSKSVNRYSSSMFNPSTLLFGILVLFAACACQSARGDDLAVTNHEVSASTASTNVVDLISAKINGFSMKDLTLDKVTDLFGRPSAVRDPGVYESRSGKKTYYGSTLYYHEKGLAFTFQHPEEDKEQHCTDVGIYLSRHWDKNFSTHFLPYSGALSRSVSANWKARRVLEAFSDFQTENQ